MEVFERLVLLVVQEKLLEVAYGTGEAGAGGSLGEIGAGGLGDAGGSGVVREAGIQF